MTERTAKVFENGRSQAVRLPREFRFSQDEVYIRKVGDEVILSPRPFSWRDFFEKTPKATDDFMRVREDFLPDERELF